jgi:nitrite reductase (NADH) large subunit
VAYNRTLLSSLLAGESTLADLTMENPEWYEKEEIEVKTKVKANKIDRRRKKIYLSSGEIVPYRKLVLATGSKPVQLNIPGSDLQGVRTFRDLEDVRFLEKLASKGGNAAVIGGGILGLEAAYGLNKLGMRVTVVHLNKHLMERQLDLEAAYYLLRYLRRLGIDVLLNTRTRSLLGKKKVEGIEFSDHSRIEADLVVLAAGVLPNIDLARSGGLTVRRGIVVDDGLCTSDPDIYAIGECAEHQRQVYGVVPPLYEQAAVCAGWILGKERKLFTGSTVWTSLKVSGLNVFSAGDFLGDPGTEQIFFKDPSLPTYKKLVIRRHPNGSHRLVGAVLVGEVHDGPWYLDLIKEQKEIRTIRQEMIFGRDFIYLN